MNNATYRAIVEKLLWIATTFRPDVNFAVNVCARHTNRPSPQHMKVATDIAAYLKHTEQAKNGIYECLSRRIPATIRNHRLLARFPRIYIRSQEHRGLRDLREQKHL